MKDLKDMPHGGRREGSGLKKGQKLKKTVDRALVREAMLLIYTKYMEEMFMAQVQRARGCELIDKSDKDGKSTFDVLPDPQAWKNITEQVIGKPVQPIEGTGDNGAFTIVVESYKNAEKTN